MWFPRIGAPLVTKNIFLETAIWHCVPLAPRGIASPGAPLQKQIQSLKVWLGCHSPWPRALSEELGILSVFIISPPPPHPFLPPLPLFLSLSLSCPCHSPCEPFHIRSPKSM